MIVSHLMTDRDAGDPDQVNDILDQIDVLVGRFMADGAYDGDPVYDAVKRHSPDPAPKVVIPPYQPAPVRHGPLRHLVELGQRRAD